MKRFAQQFKKQSDKIKLSAEEGFLLREKITTFMEYHPLPVVKDEARTTLKLDNVFKTNRISWKKMTANLGLVAVAFVVTLPVVAEYTVPGDMLYPVKVKINEEVRSTLARTPYEKVEWESERIERRLSEARILAKAGLLTPEVEEAVIDAVEQHRFKADAEIAILRENNNIDDVVLANMTLASLFEVQSTTFKNDTPKEINNTLLTASKIEPRTLAEVLEGESVERARLSEFSDISYDRLMAEIEKQTTRAYERLSSIKNSASDQEVSEINLRLEDIATRIKEAKEKIDASESEELQKALKDLQKLIAFMNDLDVRLAVTVEDIVPMSPTYEERLADFNLKLEELIIEVAALEQIWTETQEQENESDTLKPEVFAEINLYIEKSKEVSKENIKDLITKLPIMQEKIQTLKSELIDSDINEGVEKEDDLKDNTTTTATSSEQ